MSIIRSPRKESNFTIVSNKVLRDERLSYRARGILLDILSRPDNWRVSADGLARTGTEGRDAILTALNELRAFGYIVTVKKQDKSGKFSTDNYVYDIPQNTEVGLPVVGDPTPDYPKSVFQGSLEELSKKNYKEADSNESTRDLVKLYFDNLPADTLKPTGRMIAGQIQNALKVMNPEALKKLIVIVAVDGMPLTPNTLMIANKTVSEPKNLPTWTPPSFDMEEAIKARERSVPMPDNVKILIDGLRNNLPS